MLKLSSETVYLLSSGQVITSVSNAVKELVENSLDANADIIEVKLEKSGLLKIEVRDNGSGIKLTDVSVAAQRHYTSKIKSHSDLQSLATYGFRGEALCSLCEVADVTITTRTIDEPFSVIYVLDSNGQIKSKRPSHIAQGTTITVLNLFKNLPVRKQFYSSVKKIKEEMKFTEDLLMAFAVACPKVQFKLINDRCIIWQKTPTDDVKTSFLNILRSPVELHIVEHTCKINNICVKLYFPKAFIKRKSKDRFFLIINKRPIRNKQIEKLIRLNLIEYVDEAIMDKGWPVILVIIDLPSSMVDVNVNPSKTEVHISMLHILLDLLSDAFKLNFSFANKHLTSSQEKKNSNINCKPTDHNLSLHKIEESNQVHDNQNKSHCINNAKDSVTVPEINGHNEVLNPTVTHSLQSIEISKSSSEVTSTISKMPPPKESWNGPNFEENCKSCVNNSSVNSNIKINDTKTSTTSFLSAALNKSCNSNEIGSKSWSCGKAVTDNNGKNTEPVRVIRPSVSSFEQHNNISLKQSRLPINVLLKPSITNKPPTVHEVSLSSTNQKWEKLSNDEQNEMIDIACKAYDKFTNQKKATKKRKLRKSFMRLNQLSDSDDDVVDEPEKVEHTFNFLRLSKAIPKIKLNTDQNIDNFVHVVGFLSEPKIALITYKSRYYAVNLFRLQETVIFQKLSDSYKVPCSELEHSIELKESNISNCILLCLQSLNYTTITDLRPDSEILDKRITFNGFKIKKLNNSCNTLYLHAVASSIPCYGLSDLSEILIKLVNDKNITIKESRPRKCVYYLQSEASRISKSSPLCASKQQLLDDINFLKNESQSWTDVFLNSHCFHNKNIFYQIHATNPLQR